MFDVVSNSPTPRYAAGSRWAAAAAWSEQPTPGVVRVRIVDVTPDPLEAPYVDQTLDVNVGGNRAPVPVSLRFNATRTAVLVAAQVVDVSGSVTSRRWAVAKVRLGALDPDTAGQASLDPAYGDAGVARGPLTSAGGALQAMTRRGSDGAVLTGTGDFTGTDSVPTRLHVLVLNGAGQPDPTFGTAGLATIDATGDPDGPFGVPPAPQAGHDIVLGATGDITIAGGQGPNGPSFLVRLSPAGNPRLSFGTGGHCAPRGLAGVRRGRAVSRRLVIRPRRGLRRVRGHRVDAPAARPIRGRAGRDLLRTDQQRPLRRQPARDDARLVRQR